MKKALIIGIAGQDGSYLSEYLIGRGYEVHGIDRESLQFEAVLRENVASMTCSNVENYATLVGAVHRIRPDEIYYLAAHHFSSQEGQNRIGQLEPFISVNLLALNNILDVLKSELRNTKIFYAASAHIYGFPCESPQTEETPIRPDSLYAISKSAGLHLCRHYRETYGIHASVGIMYNHESPKRSLDFVTAQIARAAALILLGKSQFLVLKDLDAVVDWGAVEDYVKAMWLTLQQDEGGEYIIASGVPRTVLDFCKQAFDCVGLHAEDYVRQDGQLKKSDRLPYIGNSSKIRVKCKWEPSISFEKMVDEMVRYHIDTLKDHF